MATIYSASFMSASQITGRVGLVVPDGVVWVIRDIQVWEDGQEGPVPIYVVGSNNQIFWAFGADGTFNGSLGQWEGRVVLEAGQSMAVQPGGGTWDVTICGYQLTAP
jgi:hypothetical protein